MLKNTDSSVKLLVLYDILLKTTDEEHALSTNEIISELEKCGISVSRKDTIINKRYFIILSVTRIGVAAFFFIA